MNLVKKIIFYIRSPYLKNKYFLSLIIFFLWTLFFDQNNFFKILEYKNTLEVLETEKTEKQKHISFYKEELSALSNKVILEKFAREKYLMKRKEETIFFFLEKK